VFGRCLVFSAEHLGHFEIPEGKQEEAILITSIPQAYAEIF
jgi:hypothetical protein